MAAYSISERVTGWLADALAKETALSGEEFGYEVTALFQPTPQGNVVAWFLLMTLRSPLLGQDALGASTVVTANMPAEAGVREFATTSAELLRKSFDDVKARTFAKGNGHSDLPAGLRGKLL
jgi:hypothetical protein